MKQFFTLAFVSLMTVSSLKAQFTQSYAPSKWTTTNTSGANGTVNSTGAPASIVITGSDGAQTTNADVTFSIPAIATGVWSFSWSYHTNDTDGSAQYDPAGVVINGVFTQLTNNAGAVNQSGNYTGSSVTAGTVIGFRIRATDNIMGNATFTITSFSPPGGVLPIKLISFIGSKSGAGVKLDWQTAMETNNDRFEVERSSDNTSFNVIGTIKAAGNTSATQKYSLYDKDPFAGVNYYRLKQVDIDGNYTYSNIVTVKPDTKITAQLFPNPAQNNITLQWDASTVHTGEIALYNAAGRLLQSKQQSFRAGINKINWNISDLPAGVYYFKVDDTTIPFVVKH